MSNADSYVHNVEFTKDDLMATLDYLGNERHFEVEYLPHNGGVYIEIADESLLNIIVPLEVVARVVDAARAYEEKSA